MIPLLLAAEAAASTVCTTGGCDFSSLAVAVADACQRGGDTTIEIDGPIPADGARVTCELDLRGRNGGRLFTSLLSLRSLIVDTEAEVRIRDLVIEPNGQGALLVEQARDVVLQDVTFDGLPLIGLTNGTAIELVGATVVLEGGAVTSFVGPGGALFVDPVSVLTLERTTLSDNQALVDGGAALAYGELRLHDVVAERNGALFGVGSVAAVAGEGARLEVLGGVFVDNDGSFGGALWGSDGAEVVIDEGQARPRFQGNTTLYGGAIQVVDASLTVRHADFEGPGGPIGIEERYSDDHHHEIEDCAFRGTSAGGGTVEWVKTTAGESQASLTVHASLFQGGWSGVAPLVAQVPGGTLLVTDSRFVGNTSPSDAGAISATGVEGAIERTLFCENDGPLGAVRLSDVGSQQPFRLVNGRFLRNADRAVHLDAGRVELRHATLVDNAGAVDATDTELSFTHDLFVQNGGPPLTGTPVLTEHAHTWRWLEDDVPAQFSDPTGQVGDPGLQVSFDALGCDSDLWVDFTSPTRDAGGGEPDPDGSLADIGAYGGPSADQRSWSDDDGDGAPLMWDCDPGDPALALPALYWPDLDGDGHGAEASGPGVLACVPPSGHAPDDGDCDDARQDIGPGVMDLADDGIDQDCDGFDRTSYVAGGACGCAAAPRAGLSGLVALLLRR